VSTCRISGIVLAAGGSRRLGQPKQLLPYAGGPLLRTVVATALAASFDEVIVVLGCRAGEIREALDIPNLEAGSVGASNRLCVVVCEAWEQGLSAALQTGLAAADPASDAAAILLGDQPGVDAKLINRVIDAFATADQPLARPVFDTGTRHVPGHPVVIARSLWPELATLKGDEGARGLIAGRPDSVLEVPMEGEPPADIDTMEEFLGLRL